MAVGAARPAGRHREPAGRRHQYRHRGGGARGARRPYAVVDHRREHDQRVALREAQLQFHPRHRAGRERRARTGRDGGQPGGPGQDGPRVHRLCQGQSRQDQSRIERPGHGQPRGRRAVQDHGRHRHAARAVPRRGAGADRPDQRPGAGDDPADHLVARAHQGGTAARARRDHGDAARCRAGHPDRGRVPAGLRRERLDRHRRAARHAGRDRRPAR